MTLFQKKDQQPTAESVGDKIVLTPDPDKPQEKKEVKKPENTWA